MLELIEIFFVLKNKRIKIRNDLLVTSEKLEFV